MFYFNVLKGKFAAKGFTLLEVIISIFIVTTVVFATFSLIQQTLVAASLNKSKLIAHYLAQEEIEIVKNIRDNNWLNKRTWNEGIYEEGRSFENFTITRDISRLDPDILEIKVAVHWSERGREHNVEVINHLYNWFKR